MVDERPLIYRISFSIGPRKNYHQQSTDYRYISRFENLKNKIRTVMPILENRPFHIKWKDNPGNVIIISNDAELVFAFTDLRTTSVHFFIIAPSLFVGPENQNRRICKSCLSTTSRKKGYKCLTCNDFNLCSTCKGYFHKGHNTIRVPYIVAEEPERNLELLNYLEMKKIEEPGETSRAPKRESHNESATTSGESTENMRKKLKTDNSDTVSAEEEPMDEEEAAVAQALTVFVLEESVEEDDHFSEGVTAVFQAISDTSESENDEPNNKTSSSSSSDSCDSREENAENLDTSSTSSGNMSMEDHKAKENGHEWDERGNENSNQAGVAPPNAENPPNIPPYRDTDTDRIANAVVDGLINAWLPELPFYGNGIENLIRPTLPPPPFAVPGRSTDPVPPVPAESLYRGTGDSRVYLPTRPPPSPRVMNNIRVAPPLFAHVRDLSYFMNLPFTPRPAGFVRPPVPVQLNGRPEDPRPHPIPGPSNQHDEQEDSDNSD